MNAAARIIGKFGGTRAMAATTGWPASTIQSWKAVGVIPARRQADVLSAAKAAGIDLSPADFFEVADSADAGEAA